MDAMADLTSAPPSPPETLARGYLKDSGLLQIRVNEAATLMQEKGIQPTVRRVRAALGGGSPNDLTPALKHWREAVFPALPRDVQAATSTGNAGTLPPQLADLAMELWQRATAAAVVELKGGAVARKVADQSEETYALRVQIASLRDQLQRESLAYGELRAQAARHEAMSREALARAQEAEARERGQLRDIGTAMQKIAELEAALALHRSKKQQAARPRKSTASKAVSSPRNRKNGAARRSSKSRGQSTVRRSRKSPRKPK
jgi:hypothetical protein